MARVVNAFSKGRNATYEEPDIESRIHSRKLINIVSSFNITEIVKKLTELDPYLRNGVWYTSGRMRKRNVGLQILFIDQCLAELIMIQSHEENHEESAGTLARSRAYVWVVKGRSLARKVARSCPRCKLEKCQMIQQKVGQLLEERIETGYLPFTYISLDLLGPIKVKGIVN